MLSPLPIDPHLNEIRAAVRGNLNVILTATPGAGKTTRLPPEFLADIQGKIIVTEPRRMAAVAACDRVCRERGWPLGGECGYQVRFESKIGPSTRLIYMTDALLLRQMLRDQELKDVGLVVLDEFHERNINQDLLLGSLRELQMMGRGIKLLIMSATLSVEKMRAFLDGAAHVDVPGRVFPLEIRHSTQPLRPQTDRDFIERVAQAAEGAAGETAGDVLVFLPGTGEIRRVEERLKERGLKREIRPLHGSLPLNEQREVLAPARAPRIILATNVAEASVTVQGVDFVVDSGLAKIMEMNPRSGFESLEVARISQFNARQRAGRAAREKAGVCLRLWTPHEEPTQTVELPPEAQRVDLSSALLLLAHFGVTDFSNFQWLDHPPRVLLEIATRALRDQGLLTASNELTERGRALLRYPLPPRWAAFLEFANDAGAGAPGARIAALMNERDFSTGGAPSLQECDVLYRLGLRLPPQVTEAARQLERLLPERQARAQVSDMEVKRLLLLTQKDRLCRRRGQSERALMVGGRGVRLSPDSQVRTSEFFVVLQGVDFPGQSETLVSAACGVDKAFVLQHLKDEIETRDEIDFVEDKARFFALRVRCFRDLALEEATRTPVDSALVSPRLAEILTDKWDWLASRNEKLGHWLERWRFLVHHAPEFEAHLGREQIEKALAHACYGKTKVSEVVETDLVPMVEMNMDPEAVRALNKQVPESFLAPTGFKHRIHYRELHSAFVEVRLQELFGLAAGPKILFERVPLTFRLLGPNFRPVQVTSDLAGFWRSSYLEVRKELRARYPKHSWPEDPLSARPEAKGRRRS
jgi:ATP-dependent helicase HrpB